MTRQNPTPEATPGPRIEQRGDLQLVIYGQHDQRTIDQLIRCAEAGDAPAAVLCADGHVGYSQPIGGAIAYEDRISPTGVGVDIGCGVKGVRTNIKHEDFGSVAWVMDEVARSISFGMGRNNDEPIDHPVLDRIREAPFAPQRQLSDLAASQLGTVGGGNHYCNLMVDESGYIWVTAHFGSRGFGHRTAMGFLSLAQGKPFEAKAKDGDMDSPPVLLDTTAELGQSYIEAMQLAGEYAYAGRDVVVDKVLSILGAEATHTVHEHHNASWQEEHLGRKLWVVRKGCTQAFPGQEGVIGGSMGGNSYVVEGQDTPDAALGLHSTVHGAGRVMSRTQAAGKKKKVWVCPVRDCETILNTPAKNSHPKKGACPKHPHIPPRKLWRTVKPGLVDYATVQQRLREQGIELRGGAADEAPEVYKHLPDVLAAHGDSIIIKHTLRPIGVAMAGANVVDLYKD